MSPTADLTHLHRMDFTPQQGTKVLTGLQASADLNDRACLKAWMGRRLPLIGLLFLAACSSPRVPAPARSRAFGQGKTSFFKALTETFKKRIDPGNLDEICANPNNHDSLPSFLFVISKF